MKKTLIAILITALFVIITSCGARETERTVYVMDTVANIFLSDDKNECADEIVRELYALENELSVQDGKLGILNNNGGGLVERHTEVLTEKAIELCEKTNGTFSPYLGRLIELWDIGGENNIPSDDEIKSAKNISKRENVDLSNGKLTLRKGVKLNFGAIAKGYATDVIRGILKKNNVPGAIISLGGNVYVHGKRKDGKNFRVGIRDPKGSANDWVGSIDVTDSFIISSGNYERYFERDGKRYCHILNPETGAPADNELAAVCIIGSDGTTCDAYSTAMYVMGKKKALEFWRENKDFEAVFISNDGVITLTEGIAKKFTPNEEKRYTYEVAYG